MPPRDIQGVKQGALESKFIPDPLNPGKTINMTEAIGPPCFYPETIPVSLVRIESGAGALWLGALPGEPTRTAWSRIEKPLLALAPKGARVLPIGIANEYIGYVTTREEYAAQAYEGASDIYGPNTAELLRRVLVDLADKQMSHPPVDENHQWVEQAIFYPEAWGRGSAFGPDDEPMQSPHGDPDEALENLIVDPDGRPERHWPRFLWLEWPSGSDEEWDGNLRVVEIIAADTGKPADDDLGPNILTVFVNPGTPGSSVNRPRPGFRPYGTGPMRARRPGGGQKRKWIAIWIAPNTADVSNYYFRVKPNGRKPVCSGIFTVAGVFGSDNSVVPSGDCP